MRITVLAIGSRGDVEPYVALGLGLQASGKTVRVATHANFEALVRGRGLEFAEIGGDYRAYHESRDGREALARNRGYYQMLYQGSRVAGPLLQRVMVDCWRASEDSQALVVNQLSVVVGYHIAEKLRIPMVRAFNMPMSRTSTSPAPFLPSRLQLGARLNLLTHDLARRLLWAMLRSPTGDARSKVLGLPRLSPNPYLDMDRRRWLLLYGYSPAIVPPPPDWAEWIQVTGFWFLDRPQSWRAPAGLVHFLESGPPPVYVGFGSMTSQSPEQTTEMVVRALSQAGQRGVLVTGWGGLAPGAAAGNVYVADEVPFDWLFPKMAATVHHGGIGTTHLGLRAGVPAVVVPFMPDQHFWGRQVARLGVGPRPITRQELTVERLAEAIRVAVGDPGMRRRAAALGRHIAADDGVGRAVALINARLGAGVSSPPLLEAQGIR